MHAPSPRVAWPLQQLASSPSSLKLNLLISSSPLDHHQPHPYISIHPSSYSNLQGRRRKEARNQIMAGPATDGTENKPPGKPMSMGQTLLEKGTAMMQSLKPIKQFSQHACTFALYSHDLSRQIETHHYVSRLNEDFLQCAVYDSDDRSARLIGVEYIISDRMLEALPAEEQKLWHSHAYEIKSGLWVTPRVPEGVVKPELDRLAKTYGKFWCTWQVDRGDVLPMGEPALMVSPQPDHPTGTVLMMPEPELVMRRDDKYNVKTESLAALRVDIAGPIRINPNADYWRNHGKGFVVDVVPTEMKRHAPFP
ncbi:Oil body-associated protein 2A [Dionaea muscipula]